jgi:hypothetical protein
MFAHKYSISGSVAVIFGKVVTMIATNGKIVWQAISKYWRRKDKWKRNQNW